jgi:hypothetical protein
VALQVEETAIAPRFPSIMKPFAVIVDDGAKYGVKPTVVDVHGVTVFVGGNKDKKDITEALQDTIDSAPIGAVIVLSTVDDDDTYYGNHSWPSLTLRNAVTLVGRRAGTRFFGVIRVEEDGNGPCSCYGLELTNLGGAGSSVVHTVNVESGTIILEECSVHASKMGLATSVNVEEEGTALVLNCTLTGCVKISKGDVLVEGCTIKGSRGSGVFFKGQGVNRGIVRNCDISGSKLACLAITEVIRACARCFNAILTPF